MMYDDRDGNTVHHFNIPGGHSRLTLTADALIEMRIAPALPDSLGSLTHLQQLDHPWRGSQWMQRRHGS